MNHKIKILLAGFFAISSTMLQSDPDQSRATNINAQDDRGQTLLHKAAWQDSNESLEALLTLEPDITIVDKNGNTPLHKAALFFCIDNLKSLLRYSQNMSEEHRIHFINTPNFEGKTALYYLTHFGRADFCEILLNAGANLTVQEFGQSPLIYALQENHPNVAALFMQQGARSIPSEMHDLLKPKCNIDRIWHRFPENESHTKVYSSSNRASDLKQILRAQLCTILISLDCASTEDQCNKTIELCDDILSVIEPLKSQIINDTQAQEACQKLLILLDGRFKDRLESLRNDPTTPSSFTILYSQLCEKGRLVASELSEVLEQAPLRSGIWYEDANAFGQSIIYEQLSTLNPFAELVWKAQGSPEKSKPRYARGTSSFNTDLKK